jgi:hypothetical protein
MTAAVPLWRPRAGSWWRLPALFKIQRGSDGKIRRSGDGKISAVDFASSAPCWCRQCTACIGCTPLTWTLIASGISPCTCFNTGFGAWISISGAISGTRTMTNTDFLGCTWSATSGITESTIFDNACSGAVQATTSPTWQLNLTGTTIRVSMGSFSGTYFDSGTVAFDKNCTTSRTFPNVNSGCGAAPNNFNGGSGGSVTVIPNF